MKKIIIVVIFMILIILSLHSQETWFTTNPLPESWKGIKGIEWMESVPFAKLSYQAYIKTAMLGFSILMQEMITVSLTAVMNGIPVDHDFPLNKTLTILVEKKRITKKQGQAIIKFSQEHKAK